MNIIPNLNINEDLFRNHYLTTKSWKVHSNTEKRKDYDKKCKSHAETKINDGNVTILPFCTNVDLYRMLEPNSDQKEKICTISKHKIVKHLDTVADKKITSKKDERLNLDELALDKDYFKRMLLDEHVRMLYLRSENIDHTILREKPHLRLFLESVMHKVSSRSSALRNVLRREIQFLSNRYQINRQVQFQQTMQSLNLDEIYKKRVETANRKQIHYEQLMNDITDIWRLYYYGQYVKVEMKTSSLLSSTDCWIKKNMNSKKYKYLADIYYTRGLALMHLKRLDAALHCFKKDGEIGKSSNLRMSIERTADNIGRIHALRGHYSEAIRLWSGRLRNVINLKEKPWLCFGLAQCHAMQDDYITAMDMCYKCISSASISKSLCWEMNGNILLANYAALLGTTREKHVRRNTTISLKAINRAYQCALILADSASIRKLMKVIRHIYNSFKDMDLTLISNVWSGALMMATQRTSITEKSTSKKSSNTNNIKNYFNDVNFFGNSFVNKGKDKSVEDKSNQHITGERQDLFSAENCKNISNAIVEVYFNDISMDGIFNAEESNKNALNNHHCSSLKKSVDVCLSDDTSENSDGPLSELHVKDHR